MRSKMGKNFSNKKPLGYVVVLPAGFGANRPTTVTHIGGATLSTNRVTLKDKFRECKIIITRPDFSRIFTVFFRLLIVHSRIRTKVPEHGTSKKKQRF